MVNSTFNKFSKNLPPVKTGQRFGEQTQQNKKLGLFSERRFLIFTKRGPIEIAFKPIHYTSAIISAFVGITSIIYWSAQGIYSAIDVAQKNDIITEASANIPDPIENDSDTIENVETQSNITLPTLRKFFDDNLKENNKIFKGNDNEKTISNSHNVPKILKDKTKSLNYSLFTSTKRNQDIPNLSSQKIDNEII